MALVTATAATAAAAYLDGKFHIRKDLWSLFRLKYIERSYARAVKQHRESGFYLFEATASSYPSDVAIWSREGIYTWQETYDRVCQYASFFLSIGVKSGDLVAIYLQNSPEYIFSWLGLWGIGCAPAMINWSLAGHPLIHCLKISGAKVMILDADEGCQERVDSEAPGIGDLELKMITLSEQLKQDIATTTTSRPGDQYRDIVRQGSMGAIIYTSGTTGLPKAVPFPMMSFYRAGIAAPWLYGQHPGPGGDRWYNCMPYYHGTGGLNAMANMMAGMSLAIGRRFSISNFWADIRDSEATIFVYVGETARYLLAAPPSPLDKQHKIRLMHGNGMRPDVWAKFQERFGIPQVAEFFAATEGMMSMAVWCKGPYLVNAVGHHGLIIRRFLHNTYVPVKIDGATNDFYRSPVDGFAERVPYEDGGEIIVRVPSENAFPGYYRAPEATAKKFAHDVLQKNDIYYRPGDSLKRTQDGRWFFMDRLGDTYRWKSENVSTAEVAQALGRYPAIHEANVYGVLLPNHDGRAGCAAVAIDRSERKTFDWRDFANFARQSLPRYAVPVFIRVVDSEVGAMGGHNNKQNKVLLRDEGVDPELTGTRVECGKEDEVLWLPPQGDRYVKFQETDWNNLIAGKARL